MKGFLPRRMALFGPLILAFCLSSISALAQSANCDVNKPIRFGGLDWDSNSLHVEIARYILEKGYGCKTENVPGTSLPLIAALGRGDIDVLMEVWLDNVTEAWERLEDEGKVSTVGINFPDAVQGFYVPAYLVQGDKDRGIEAAAPNLKHVDDLPKYWELFKDPEQPEKGRLYNCPLGWSCEDVNTKKLLAYGLMDTYVNFRPGTGAALAAAIASAYERGDPFVGYYWGPTWMLGKYSMIMLEEPPYNKDIWLTLGKQKHPTQATAYPLVAVYVGVNNEFKARAPGVVSFLRNYESTNEIVSNALAYMQEGDGHTAKEAALEYLRNHVDVWSDWVTAEAEEHIKSALGEGLDKKTSSWIFKIDKPINAFVSWLTREFQNTFDDIAGPIRAMIIGLEHVLKAIPWWLIIGIFAAAAYWASRRIALTALVAGCLLLIGGLGLWDLSIQTLALMLISTLITVLIGIPVGIALAYSNRLRQISLPVLDAMQTMPSFVYLIPALMFFGLGKVPAVFATVIYAVSPLIRLTDLGIRRVDPEVVEAARAFGARPSQLLGGVQLPLALPTIMAGVNQTTMLALSMVVIASMIGSRGLGQEVLLGIQKLDVGRGFTAGIGIVALAIVLDRITQAFGHRLDKTRH